MWEYLVSWYQFIRDYPYKDFFNFGNWAHWTTPKELYWGVIPPITAILTLFVVASVMTGAALAWAALLGPAGYIATTMASSYALYASFSGDRQCHAKLLV